MVSTQDIKLGLAADKLKQPLHVKVRQILREQILSDFEHGQRFYTERELIQKLEVSQVTVRRAVQDLVGEGFLQTDPRRGLFVQRHKDMRFIGLVTPAHGDHLETEFLSLCRPQGYDLDVHAFHENETAGDILRLLRHKPSEERVILTGLTVELTLELGSLLQAEGYQYLVVGAKPAGLSGGTLSFDHEGEVNQILDYLTGLGHERICFMVNEPRNLLITNLRAAAVQANLRRRNLTQAQLIYCDTRSWEYSFDAAYTKTRELMRQKPTPTAIVPLSGVGAWAALRFAIEQKIRVPEDLSIVSFDPVMNSIMLPVPLTEMAFSRADFVLAALRLVWSDEASTANELFTPRLLVRASTGAPPSSS